MENTFGLGDWLLPIFYGTAPVVLLFTWEHKRVKLAQDKHPMYSTYMWAVPAMIVASIVATASIGAVNDATIGDTIAELFGLFGIVVAIIFVGFSPIGAYVLALDIVAKAYEKEIREKQINAFRKLGFSDTFINKWLVSEIK